MVDNNKHIRALEDKIKELRRSLPAHSVPAAMLIELEDLEERLLDLQAVLDQKTNASA